MKIQVLGVGGCFSPELGNSSIILWDKGSKGFLIDCGYSVYPLLKQKKLIEKIDRLFITHRHSDHIGSLDAFLYHKRWLCKQKVKFYGVGDHLPFLKMIDSKFEEEFDQYFEVDNESIQVISTDHAPGVSPSHAFYNYGVLYSGDTSESLLDKDEAFDARVILHEVSFSEASNVHTPFSTLARASADIKKKTWLYHYELGQFEEYDEKVKTHGFRGLLKKDQTIVF